MRSRAHRLLRQARGLSVYGEPIPVTLNLHDPPAVRAAKYAAATAAWRKSHRGKRPGRVWRETLVLDLPEGQPPEGQEEDVHQESAGRDAGTAAPGEGSGDCSSPTPVDVAGGDGPPLAPPATSAPPEPESKLARLARRYQELRATVLDRSGWAPQPPGVSWEDWSASSAQQRASYLAAAQAWTELQKQGLGGLPDAEELADIEARTCEFCHRLRRAPDDLTCCARASVERWERKLDADRVADPPVLRLDRWKN